MIFLWITCGQYEDKTRFYPALYSKVDVFDYDMRL